MLDGLFYIFIYYCLKSDLEDKLQTYNKINGAIGRHFGKQMNKETKLRIYNITAKANIEIWKWSLATEEKRGTTFRNSTDKIFWDTYLE